MLKDFIGDKSNFSPLEVVIREVLEMRVDNILCKHSSKEELVIKKRSGIGGDTSKTLEEVGEEWDVTPERIRRIKVRAIQELRSSGNIAEFFKGNQLL